MSNLITTKFTASDYVAMDASLTNLETTVKGKTVSLTPEERMTIGKVGDHYGVAVEEVNDALTTNPSFAPDPETFVVADFRSDREAAKALRLRIVRMENILQQLKDTEALHNADLYSDLIVFYGHIQVQAKNNKPGARTIFASLSRFFKRRRKSTTDTPPAL